jgi:uncharacterized protein (TIGR03437 family)
VKKLFYLGLLVALRPACAAADSPHAAYTISTVAGSSSFGDGGPAIDAQLSIVQGVAADSLGNIYLSDTNHNCVRRIGPTGVIATVAGNGTAGFSGDGGPATSAQLNFPYGVAVDAAGNLYIADLNNNRVRRVSPTGVIETYAGSGGNGSSGDGGPATSAQMLSPRNLAVDSAGNLYISEFAAHRIRKVAPNGIISTAAGDGIAGFRGDGGPATAAQLAFPTGLAFDRMGGLYIADSQNQRIRQVLTTGQIVTVLGGSSVTLLTPVAVAVDSSGNLYVADSTPAVHEYTTAGKFVTAAGSAAAGFSGDNGPATSAQLTQPLDLSFDAGGNLYIADRSRVREVNPRGIVTTVAGAAYLFGIGDGGAATAAELYLPSAAALDTAGNLYIADAGANRVRRASSSGIVTTVAGTGVAAPGGESTPAAATPLINPTAVAIDPYGNLLIVETGANRIRQVAADGLIRTVAGTGAAGLGPDSLPPAQTQLDAPRGLCLDRTGNLYVVDTANQRVLFAPLPGVVATAAGNGAAGSAGDGGPAPFAQLNQPTACALDSAGNLYIADTYNHRIRRVDSTGNIATVAGTGAAGYAGDEGPATAATLNAPRGIAADDNGDIFISDSGNNVLRQVTSDGVIHTIAGTTAGFAGDGGPALSAAINTPGGILLDGSGDLYFADTGNSRVRQLVPLAVTAPPSTALPVPLAVMNAASLSTGPVAPGEAISIFGSGLGPQTGVTALLNPNSLLSTQLAGSQVFFDAVAAPLFFAQSGQINAQVPYTVAGNATTNVTVVYQGVTVNSAALAVAASAPGVFSTTLNQDGSSNSISNPAPAGSYLTVFATGEGLTNGANLAGQPAAAPCPRPNLPVNATVAGIAAQIVWYGSAPGLVGILQVNLAIPGPYLPSGPALLQLTIGTATAPVMTVWIQ